MSIEGELGFRKSIHIKLYHDTHAGLRVTLFRKKLSMQETLEECASLIAQEDPTMMRIIDDLAKRKREKIIKSFSKNDADTLLDVIGRESPMVEDD